MLISAWLLCMFSKDGLDSEQQQIFNTHTQTNNCVTVSVCLCTHRCSMKPKTPLTSWSLERRFLLSTKPAERRKCVCVCVFACCEMVVVCMHICSENKTKLSCSGSSFFSSSVFLPHLWLKHNHRFSLCQLWVCLPKY